MRTSLLALLLLASAGALLILGSGAPATGGPGGLRQRSAASADGTAANTEVAPVQLEAASASRAKARARPQGQGELQIVARLAAGRILRDGEEHDGIWVLDPDHYNRKAFRSATRRLGRRRAWELVQEFGTRLGPLSFETGRVQRLEIATPGKGSEVVLRAGGLVGRRKVAFEKGGRLEIELRSALVDTVHMLVVDSRGALVPGVPVLQEYEDVQQMGSRSITQGIRRSDERGTVSLLPKLGSTFVIPEVLGAREESSIKEGGEIRMPPFGAILLDLEGGPFSGHLTITSDERGWNRSRSLALMDSRSVLVERVGLGQSLTVSGRLQGASLHAPIEGPLVNGETVQISVYPTRNHLVTARLLDESGAPVTDMRATIDMDRPGWFAHSDPSDENGRILVELDSKHALPAGERQILVHAWRATRERYRGRFAAVGTPKPDHRGVLDLGDVVLREQPLLFGGRVLGADGNPVAQASVRWKTQLKPGHDLHSALTGISGTTSRAYRPQLLARTDDEGRFEFRAAVLQHDPEFEDLVATARHSESGPSEPLIVEPFSQNVELILGKKRAR